MYANITASAEERGRRRYEQLRSKGFDASLRALVEDIRARDERDTNRAVAPLRPAADALVIDSTALTISEVRDQIMNRVRDNALI